MRLPLNQSPFAGRGVVLHQRTGVAMRRAEAIPTWGHDPFGYFFSSCPEMPWPESALSTMLRSILTKHW